MVNEREETEKIVLNALVTIGETMFEEIVFRLENSDEKLKELPLRAYILGEEAILKNRAISLIDEVKKIYQENGLKVIKREILNTLESTYRMTKKHLEIV